MNWRRLMSDMALLPPKSEVSPPQAQPAHTCQVVVGVSPNCSELSQALPASSYLISGLSAQRPEVRIGSMLSKKSPRRNCGIRI
jgi:hypothetical protein